MAQFTLNSYDHGGVLLNLSGYRDADECVIQRVTAADSQIDLFDLFEARTLESMAECADAQLSREAAEQCADSIRSRFEFERFARHL